MQEKRRGFTPPLLSPMQRVFPTEGDGGSPPIIWKFAHPPHLEKSPTTKFLSTPPTKQQFLSYNPIKTAFLDVVIVPALFFFKISYSFDTQAMLILILIDVQYSKKAALV